MMNLTVGIVVSSIIALLSLTHGGFTAGKGAVTSLQCLYLVNVLMFSVFARAIEQL